MRSALSLLGAASLAAAIPGNFFISHNTKTVTVFETAPAVAAPTIYQAPAAVATSAAAPAPPAQTSEVAAAPAAPADSKPEPSSGTGYCSSLVDGLTVASCELIQSLGLISQGANAASSSKASMWVGEDGANLFEFTNTAKDWQMVVGWVNVVGTYTKMNLNVEAPAITYTLAPGESITISVANGISGAFSSIDGQTSTLFNGCLVDNTWAEFTTGDWATINISREVNMNGRSISAKVNQCTTDMDTCVFRCLNKALTCGEPNTYEIANCDPKTNPGAQTGTYGGQPQGGCSDWNNGGHIKLTLG